MTDEDARPSTGGEGTGGLLGPRGHGRGPLSHGDSRSDNGCIPRFKGSRLRSTFPKSQTETGKSARGARSGRIVPGDDATVGSGVGGCVLGK